MGFGRRCQSFCRESPECLAQSTAFLGIGSISSDLLPMESSRAFVLTFVLMKKAAHF